MKDATTDTALLTACRAGDTTTALRLIAEGADIHARDEERMSPMALACRAGAEDIVAELLRRGISPNERADIGLWEVFYYAAESGNISLMRRLVQAGADPWVSDWEDDTALSAAVLSGNPAAFDFLLEMGLSMDHESVYMGNFMICAAHTKGLHMLEHLLELGGNIHSAEWNRGLDHACEEGRCDIVRRLLQEESVLAAQQDYPSAAVYELLLRSQPFDASAAHRLLAAGCPCCHLSADREPRLRESAASPEAIAWLDEHEAELRCPVRSEATAEQLYDAAHESTARLRQVLTEGKELRAVGKDGTTALHLACAEGDGPAILRLLEAGADARPLTYKGYSVLTMPSLRGKRVPLDCVRPLLEHGLDPTRIGDEGFSILGSLILEEQDDIVTELLRLGADISHRDAAGYTPFLIAARFGSTTIAERLAERGADTRATLPDGRTALHLAAKANKAEMVRYLLAAGLDVNALDRRGYTPLLCSSAPAIAHLLLDAGADPLRRGKNGLTALMAVEHSNELGIRDRLLSAGVDPEATTLWGAKTPERRWY